MPAAAQHLVGLDDPGKRLGYTAMAGWLVLLGVFLIAAPPYFFGTTWYYFAEHGYPVPPGGKGMGVCLLALGLLELHAVRRRHERYLAVLFFCSAFVFWTAGILLGIEGWLGQQGLMDAALCIAFSIDKFVTSANAHVDYRSRSG